VRVGEDDGVARILRRYPREWIEVRLIADVQPVLVERRVDLYGREQLGRVTGEDGDAIGGRLQAVLQVRRNPLHISFQHLALGAARRIRLRARLQFLAHERLEMVPAAVVRLCVQIQADDRIRRGFEGGKAVQLVVERHGVEFLRKPRATPVGG
jgi:hypothetical protein